MICKFCGISSRHFSKFNWFYTTVKWLDKRNKRYKDCEDINYTLKMCDCCMNKLWKNQDDLFEKIKEIIEERGEE